MITDLDRIWAQVNAIGGSIDPNDPFDRGYRCAIDHALMVIERHGGKDPLVRAAEGSTDPVIDWPRTSYHKQAHGTSVLPLSRLDALNGDPDEAA